MFLFSLLSFNFSLFSSFHSFIHSYQFSLVYLVIFLLHCVRSSSIFSVFFSLIHSLTYSLSFITHSLSLPCLLLIFSPHFYPAIHIFHFYIAFINFYPVRYLILFFSFCIFLPLLTTTNYYFDYYYYCYKVRHS